MTCINICHHERRYKSNNYPLYFTKENSLSLRNLTKELQTNLLQSAAKINRRTIVMERQGTTNWVYTTGKNITEMHETAKHIYENALEFKNLTNAEEFNLERSAPPAQKWMALFNKIYHITDLENGKSDFNEKIKYHPEYPSQDS